jgi:hypothetical protein
MGLRVHLPPTDAALTCMPAAHRQALAARFNTQPRPAQDPNTPNSTGFRPRPAICCVMNCGVIDAPTTRPDIRIGTKEIHDWSFTRMLNEPAASRNARILGRLPLGVQFTVPVRE